MTCPRLRKSMTIYREKELARDVQSELIKELHILETFSDFSNKTKFLSELYKAGELKKSKFETRFSIFPDLKPLTHETLEKLYWNCVEVLGLYDKVKLSTPTEFERRCFQVTRGLTRAKFYKSFWIKNFCVDFFIPRYLAVLEVDGGIHFNEIKMRKDNFKEDYLKRVFKIPVWRVDNSNIQKFIYTILPNLSPRNKKSSKAIKKGMRNIFIETIAYHSTFNDLKPLLGDDVLLAYRHFCQLKNTKQENLHGKLN